MTFVPEISYSIISGSVPKYVLFIAFLYDVLIIQYKIESVFSQMLDILLSIDFVLIFLNKSCSPTYCSICLVKFKYISCFFFSYQFNIHFLDLQKLSD